MSSASTTSSVSVSDGTDANTTIQDTTVSTFSKSTFMSLPAQLDFLFLNAQIILSAMSIIWLGSIGSLRRPPSAAPAEKEKGKKRKEEDKFAEGFIASDAIMMPLMAGAVLMGLYYLIKWMEDPDMINKIMRTYMSVLSVASVGKAAADGLHLLTGVVFPSLWVDGNAALYKIDFAKRRQVLLSGDPSTDVIDPDKKTPFPGWMSTIRLPEKLNAFMWEARHLLTEEWTLRLALHGLGSVKTKLKLNDIMGLNVALAVVIGYYLTGWFWLSNILGSAFSYAAFSLISPTSFAIGTGVLAGLFVYDIVMVFYTPYMITVATKLDVPIKLVFHSTSRASMLGLGDIVVPGVFIALALRFDLWRYYEKKIQYIPAELTVHVQTDSGDHAIATTQYRTVKAPFVALPKWGDWLWTRQPFSNRAATPLVLTAKFQRTYFYAAMGGYALGMVLTLVMLLVFKHGQPALLYLVPCVAGAVWLTGALRGELNLMHRYNEDGSLDTEDVVVELDGNGQVIKETTNERNDKAEAGKASGETEHADADLAEKSDDDDGYAVFLISLTAPRQRNAKEA